MVLGVPSQLRNVETTHLQGSELLSPTAAEESPVSAHTTWCLVWHGAVTVLPAWLRRALGLAAVSLAPREVVVNMRL